MADRSGSPHSPVAAPSAAQPSAPRLHHWQQHTSRSAWLASALLHGALFAALGHSMQQVPQGAAFESSRESGIVLVSRSAGQAEYFPAESAELSLSSASTADSTSVPITADAPRLLATLPQLPTNANPQIDTQVAAASLVSTSAISPSAIQPARMPARGRDLGVETQVFGVKGTGSKFVYVFDRSSSMEGAPLLAAKRELIASLQSLQSVHQFQIVLYNQEPQRMAVRGQSRQLVFADEPGKRLAARFVGGITAYGSTDHLQALRTALLMRPDVIFFLTDAEELQFSQADFAGLRRLNQGTQINTLEFGAGPPQPGFSFLVKLAQENGGQHAYIDITRLAR